MEEGLNLNLMMNGATLGTVAALAVKVWLSGRAQKIEQPLEVRAAAQTTPRTHCDERHKILAEQIENMFARMGKVERENTSSIAKEEALEKQLASMDSKLDILLRR
jgi:hypothetical protein